MNYCDAKRSNSIQQKERDADGQRKILAPPPALALAPPGVCVDTDPSLCAHARANLSTE